LSQLRELFSSRRSTPWRSVTCVDQGTTDLAALSGTLSTSTHTAWVRVVTGPLVDGAGPLLYALVVVGPEPHRWSTATWPYEQCLFASGAMAAGELAAAIAPDGPRVVEVGDLKVNFELADGQFQWQRKPSYAKYDELQFDWPTVIYTPGLASRGSVNAPPGYLVGAGETHTFPVFASAFGAFFYGDYAVSSSRNPVLGQMSVRLVDERARITGIHKDGPVLYVEVSGSALESAVLELNSAIHRATVPLAGGDGFAFDLPGGTVPDDAWVWLKDGGEWRDYRSLQRWGGELSPDVDLDPLDESVPGEASFRSESVGVTNSVLVAGPSGVRSFRGVSGQSWTFDEADELGRGGFGVVYSGEGPGDLAVAVKALDLTHPRAASLDQLMREVEIAGRIAERSREYLLPVIDHAVDGTILFLVMERAEGSLATAISATMSEEDKLAALRDTAAGLAELHGIPVLHRDLKPANVLLHKGKWKLADFGIARDLDETTATLTWAGAGSLHYMAPELFDPPYAASVKSDLYALGCLAYELWAGGVPFVASDAIALVRLHKEEPVPSLAASDNVAIRRLVVRLLEKDPHNRPQDARAVVDALGRVAIGPLSPSAARLQALATQHLDERAARSAADHAAKEAEEEHKRLVRQAVADLRGTVEDGGDLVNEALRDVTLVAIGLDGEGGRLELQGPEGALTFTLWTPLVPFPGPPPGSSYFYRGDHLLYGQVDGDNLRVANQPPLANIVCEVEEGRIVWTLYRYRRRVLPGTTAYLFGVANRRHGFTKSDFFSNVVFPHAFRDRLELHIFSKEASNLSPESVRDLYGAALSLPDDVAE
jgi:hypothetical protein